MLHTQVFIFFVFFVVSYISVVFSANEEINYTTFFNDNHRYDRLCSYNSDLLKYDPGSLCRRLAGKLDPNRDSDEIRNQVSGKCNKIKVKLYDDRPRSTTPGQPYAVEVNIVLCQILASVQKCISASAAGDAVEYYDYNADGESGLLRCTHSGQMIISN